MLKRCPGRSSSVGRACLWYGLARLVAAGVARAIENLAAIGCTLKTAGCHQRELDRSYVGMPAGDLPENDRLRQGSGVPVQAHDAGCACCNSVDESRHRPTSRGWRPMRAL